MDLHKCHIFDYGYKNINKNDDKSRYCLIEEDQNFIKIVF